MWESPRHIKQANKGVSISSVFLSRIGVYWKEEFKKKITSISLKRRPFSVLLLLLTVGLRWPLIRYWVSTQNCQRITIKSQHFYIHLHTHISDTQDESLERNDKGAFSIDEQDDITFWFDQFREREGEVEYHTGGEAAKAIKWFKSKLENVTFTFKPRSR